MRKILFAAILLSVIITDVSYAQVTNTKISIQGVLREVSGVAVTDGEYDFIFSLYNVPTGGTSLFTETHEDVDVVNGIYSVKLGQYESLDALDFDEIYYVGVTVDTIEVLPRTELTHSAYALSAVSVTCTGAVGDIKYSYLGETDFKEANGDCWEPLDGSQVDANKTLSEDYGISTLSDMSGLFLRAHEWNDSNDPDRSPSSTIGTLQLDDNKSHTHTASRAGEHTHTMSYAGGHSHKLGTGYGPAGTGSSIRERILRDVEDSPNSSGVKTSVAGEHTHKIYDSGLHTHTITASGGSEARPKSMNFYIYIRVD